MIFRKLNPSFLVISLLSLNTTAFAGGGMDGGGGDSVPACSTSAWFVGSEPVKYCIDWKQSFGPAKEIVRTAIEKSLQHWRKYIDLKKVNTAPEYRINMNYQYVPACDGKEDVRFFAGATSLEVKAAKKKYSNPTAFSKPVTRDFIKGRTKGFVWIAPRGSVEKADPNIQSIEGRPPVSAFPDWSVPTLLDHMLLHEVGHLLGNPHVPGTIMDEQISDLLAFYQLLYQTDGVDGSLPAPTIDGKVELADTSISEGVGFAASYFKLTGKKSVGNISIQIDQTKMPAFLMTFTDQSGGAAIVLEGSDLKLKDVVPLALNPVFGVCKPYRKEDGLDFRSGFAVGMATFEGNIKNFEGSVIRLYFKSNLQSEETETSPLEIFYRLGEERVPVFRRVITL